MFIDILGRSLSAHNFVRRLQTLIFQASGRDRLRARSER